MPFLFVSIAVINLFLAITASNEAATAPTEEHQSALMMTTLLLGFNAVLFTTAALICAAHIAPDTFPSFFSS
jgi:hypothetical protein